MLSILAYCLAFAWIISLPRRTYWDSIWTHYAMNSWDYFHHIQQSWLLNTAEPTNLQIRLLLWLPNAAMSRFSPACVISPAAPSVKLHSRYMWGRMARNIARAGWIFYRSYTFKHEPGCSQGVNSDIITCAWIYVRIMHAYKRGYKNNSHNISTSQA